MSAQVKPLLARLELHARVAEKDGKPALARDVLHAIKLLREMAQ